MDESIFMDKNQIPEENELREVMKNHYDWWNQIKKYALSKYPKALMEWNFPGKKYGWSFRIKDKKRAIVYLLPRDGYFMVAFVFGQKATDVILNSVVNEKIKEELRNARKYAEGRGIRIPVNDIGVIKDVKTLIDIKLSY